MTSATRHLAGLTGNDTPDHRRIRRYKGFEIRARPYQLADSGRWTVDLEIRRYGWRQAFSADQRFETSREAEAECTGLARRIIDGQVPGWSVDAPRGDSPNRRVLLHAHHGQSVRPLLVAGLVALCLGAFVFLRGVIP